MSREERAGGAKPSPASKVRSRSVDFGARSAVALLRMRAAAVRQGRRLAVVDTSGGLGNQLFQYAFGRYLATRGFEVVHEIRRLGPRADAAGRTYQLQPLAPRTVALPGNRLLRGGLRRALGLRLVSEGGDHVFAEVARDAPGHRLFSGYWQHPGYGDACRDELRATLAKIHVEHPLQARPGIVVGARRGDYAQAAALRATHGVLSPDYYVAALRSAPAGLPIYLFSDDTPWAAAVLRPWLETRLGRPVQVIADEFDAWQTLALMSGGLFHVIANSTFHWWAAALSSASRGCIAPEPWLRPHSGRGGILMPAWTTAPACFE